MDSTTTQQEVNNDDELMMQVQNHIWKNAFSFISSMSLKCAVELGIPDIIHNHGKPMTLSNLVDALSLPPAKKNYLNRLMRFLIHYGFFATQKLDENQEEDGYLLTPFSKVLVKGNTNTLSAVVLAMVDPVMVTPLHFLSAWFRGSSDGPTTFEAAHNMEFWNFQEQHPDFGNTFNDAMANDSNSLMTVIVKEGKAVFENLKSLVDVGGGTGTVARIISEAFPHLKCMVLDLPNVVADHSPTGTNNLEFIGGDMFESIPHADAVLMKNILHDWDDNDCERILKRCKEAIPSREEGGKLIIIDIVMEYDGKQENEKTETQLLFDIMMMALFTAKERTEKEWKKLFLESGFTSYKITPLLGFRSIIEVYP